MMEMLRSICKQSRESVDIFPVNKQQKTMSFRVMSSVKQGTDYDRC